MISIKNLNYVHENYGEPIAGSDEVFDFSLGDNVPLYENVDLLNSIRDLDIWNIEDFASLLLYEHERVYYSLDLNKVRNSIVKVNSVDTQIEDDTLYVTYNFTNGQIYNYATQDDFDVKTLTQLRKAAIEAAGHFFILNKSFNCDILEFKYERWG